MKNWNEWKKEMNRIDQEVVVEGGNVEPTPVPPQYHSEPEVVAAQKSPYYRYGRGHVYSDGPYYENGTIIWYETVT